MPKPSPAGSQEWLVAFSLWAVCTVVYFTSTVGTMNSMDAPQFALVRAIVEEHRTNIDSFSRYVWPDFATYQGKLFSDREPGLPFVMIPFYPLAKGLSPFAQSAYHGTHPFTTQESPLEAVMYGLTATLAALAPLFIYCIARQLGYPLWPALTSAFLFAFGTLLWKYSAAFVRQPVVATLFLALIVMYLAVKKQPTISRLTLYGLILGWCLITDHVTIFASTIFLVMILDAVYQTTNTGALLTALGFGLSIPLSLFLLYNTLSFANPFTSPRTYSQFKEFRKMKNVFAAPLSSSVPMNLFSANQPIPQEALRFFAHYPEIASNNASLIHFGSVWPYKGIFMQSPFLFLAVAGLLLMKSKRLALLFFLLFLSYFLPASKFAFFYSPTAYDTRYLLPSVAFLSLGMAPFLDWVKRRSKSWKLPLLGLTIVASLISVINGIVSVARHYAPHVSGEHRFEFVLPLVSWENIRLVLIHALPNIYNLHLILLFVLVIFVLAWGLQSLFFYSDDKI